MEVIYCDNHILVVVKKAGIKTQPDLHEMARGWIKTTYKKLGNVFLEPIHRLDSPVGGLVLFGRTSKALSRLNEAMRERKIKKTYIAWVEGQVDEKGELEHHLVHGTFRAVIDPSGKLAKLSYLKLKGGKGRSLIQIALHTGRYHQIRAQFGAIGHPIVGDIKYGASQAGELLLHHAEMSFPHPTTGKWLTFQSQVPYGL